MNTNTFVVPVGQPASGGGTTTPTPSAPPTFGQRVRRTRVAYDSHLSNSDVTVTIPTSSNFGTTPQLVNDFRTTDRLLVDLDAFNTTNTAHFGITFTSTTVRDFQFFAMAGVNFETSQINTVNVYYTPVGQTQEQLLVTINTQDYRDNQPLIIYFDTQNSNAIRVEFEDGVGTLEVALIYAGGANQHIDMGELPDAGFQPGMWNNLNAPLQNISPGNSFGGLLTNDEGTEERYSFSQLPTSFLNTEYRRFVKRFRYFPVFSQWNSLDYPTHVIFGRMDIDRASLRSGTIGRTSFRIRGII